METAFVADAVLAQLDGYERTPVVGDVIDIAIETFPLRGTYRVTGHTGRGITLERVPTEVPSWEVRGDDLIPLNDAARRIANA